MAGTKVIATKTISRTLKQGTPGDKNKGLASTPPETQTIRKGTVFVSEGEELADLKRQGAVREPGPDEKVEVAISDVPVTAQEAAKDAEAEQQQAALEEAQSLGVKGVRKGMKLETLREKIEEFKAEQAANGGEGAADATETAGAGESSPI